MTTVVRTTPWIVGRDPLLEHASEDFMTEVTRQQPWHKVQFEALFEGLEAFLSQELEQDDVFLADYRTEQAQAWLDTLERQTREQAHSMLEQFDTYLLEFGWRAQYAAGHLLEHSGQREYSGSD